MHARLFLFLILASFAFANVALSVEKKRVIKLAAVDLSPYVSESADTRGFLFQLIAQVFTNAGYAVDIEFYPSLRAKELVASGARDALIPAFRENKTSQPFILSAPIYESQITKIKLKGFDAEKKSRKAIARDCFFRTGRIRDERDGLHGNGEDIAAHRYAESQSHRYAGRRSTGGGGDLDPEETAPHPLGGILQASAKTHGAYRFLPQGQRPHYPPAKLR